MDPRIAAAWALLPGYLGQHVLLSASALLLGLAISLPLAVAASRSAVVRWPALVIASLVQTIPSLALLALFYPLLLALSALTKGAFGFGFPALGFLPSLLALTLYSMLPILRNGVAGIAGVDPAIVEAARGVGMTDRQRLFQVELPLAAPVIMAGVRTAAVWTIGAATLATPVGQTSLGNYIFSGLQTENWVYVLFGCAASAALAMAADQLLGLIESGLAMRARWRIVTGAVGLAVGAAVALAPLAVSGAAPARYVVGAKNFSEQYVLAELIADRLQAAGATVGRKEDLGSNFAYDALKDGEIDAYVDYSGTLWANVLKRTDNPGRQAVLAELTTELKRRDGVVVLGSLGLRERLCAGHAPIRGRGAAHQDPRRPLGRPRRPAHLRRRPGVPLATGMDRGEERLRPALQGHARVPADLHVPRPDLRPGRRDLGLFQRRPHRRRRPGGAGRPAPRPAALRCGGAGLAEAGERRACWAC